MRNFLLLFALLISPVSHADVKISQLPLGSAATTGINDSFPYVDAQTVVTKRMTLWDIVNLPPFAGIAMPQIRIITGSSTATFSDHYILSNSTSTINIALPNLGAATDPVVFEIKNINTGQVNLNPFTSLQTIDGNTSFSFNSIDQAIKLVSKGGLWFIF